VIFGAKWEIELNFLYSKMNALSGRASQVLIWLEGWEKLDPPDSALKSESVKLKIKGEGQGQT
jgi:hypothetical protein